MPRPSARCHWLICWALVATLPAMTESERDELFTWIDSFGLNLKAEHFVTWASAHTMTENGFLKPLGQMGGFSQAEDQVTGLSLLPSPCLSHQGDLRFMTWGSLSTKPTDLDTFCRDWVAGAGLNINDWPNRVPDWLAMVAAARVLAASADVDAELLDALCAKITKGAQADWGNNRRDEPFAVIPAIRQKLGQVHFWAAVQAFGDLALSRTDHRSVRRR